MKLFPTVEVLAQATNTEVLSARSGLGYNSRGLRVKQTAEKIVLYHSELMHQSISWDDPESINNKVDTETSSVWHNLFPITYEELIALPWVGDYVASAILAFAHNADVAVIDTNIRRILIHQFGLDEKISLKDLKNIAIQVLPSGYACPWYNALMDYGALELTAKKSGIRPTTRQSKFEWSRRQVRAWIVKEVISSKLWIISHTDIENRFPDRNDVQSIIDELVKENIIEIREWNIMIKN